MRSLRVDVLAASLASAVVLCGCGGGGGGGSGNRAPTAAARVVGESVLQATTVFDTTGTVDADGTVTAGRWDYGDGQSGTDESHVYARTGTYTATYTVTDDQGASSSVSVQVNVAKCSAAGTQAAALSPFPTVCMQTTLGELVLEVFPNQAPQTAANFLRYVADGFYSGTLIHRVVGNFVIQGGGFVAGMTPKPPTYAPVALESNNGLRNWQYTVAMARTSVPNSATSQFFVNLVDNFGLDYNPALGAPNGYAVFGQVISGTDVVDAIGVVPTGARGGFTDVPLTEIVIRSAVQIP